MNSEQEIKLKVQELIKRYYSSLEQDFVPGKTKIPLAIPSFGWEEVWEVLESMLSSKVTMGEKVRQFEVQLAAYLEAKHVVMTNSGSSANLLALSALASPTLENRIKNGNEVIVPAVAWSTTLFPVLNIQAIPVLVDVDLETYNISFEQLKKAVTSKTKAVVAVHIAGNPCEMRPILDFAHKKKLFVIEDSCESLGAEIEGKKVGSFSDMATFSFFFTHQLSTIEGGAVATNNDEYADILRSLRAHGWIREMSSKKRIAKQFKHIDEAFLFYTVGFNLRPTELQGAFGMHQLKKLDDYIESRRKNAEYWLDSFSTYSRYLAIPVERDGTRHSWFSYPLLIKENAPFTKQQLVKFLRAKLIEARGVIAGGNLAEQPVMELVQHRVVGSLPNSRLVMRNSLMFGNHQDIRKEEREYIASCMRDFVRGSLFK